MDKEERREFGVLLGERAPCACAALPCTAHVSCLHALLFCYHGYSETSCVFAVPHCPVLRLCTALPSTAPSCTVLPLHCPVLCLCTALPCIAQVHLLDSYLSTHGLEPIVSTDVGSHQCLLTQYLRLHHPRQWLTEGGLASMGCGMPAAIGAAIANPNKTCLAVCGDGGFAMTSQVCICMQGNEERFCAGGICVTLKKRLTKLHSWMLCYELQPRSCCHMHVLLTTNFNNLHASAAVLTCLPAGANDGKSVPPGCQGVTPHSPLLAPCSSLRFYRQLCLTVATAQRASTFREALCRAAL